MAKETKKPGEEPSSQPAGAQPGNTGQQFDYSEYAGEGFENVSQSDLGIPYLGIVQSNSPQFDVTKPKYPERKIEGCKPGDLFNTLTKTLIPQPAIVLPCSYQKLFVEWVPREKGGGMVKVHRDEAILMETTKGGRENKQDVLRNGNLIATTAYFYCLIKIDGKWKGDDGKFNQIVIGMTSTALKASRGWLNLMNAIKLTGPRGKFTPPFYSHTYKITTALENKNDNAWFGWQISMNEFNNEPDLVAEGRAVAKLVASGKQLALPSAEAAPAGEDVPM